ncbi:MULTISPECIES: 2,3,4,5-tetrahydropyridine-2,6-dicarboxylate N-succinyltransferase [Candidatus Ichthyocystis]|uniref:2,3,4,5-tetrahydropyridine-2,6-dicarboxylate N-succinyltransferase n=1 Tax=Candidatus Ichthyocystis TaxID=2929841 RepID=UPI000B28E2B3|nr:MULTISPECIES: 2,3,4,5-tetrahydropyridine-2,6-dicarboxylate N-succinyltransferase [Ichthyocystis]
MSFQMTDENIVNKAWIERTSLSSKTIAPEYRDCINRILSSLDNGYLRLAEFVSGEWITHEWLKKAIVLSFRTQTMKLYENGVFRYFDMCKLKFSDFDENDFYESKCRVVPGAIVRFGSYVAPSVILMPCFVNVGCYVDKGTMIDIGAVLGGGAQIGKNCHISANSVIGGVLEPIQDRPVIIEDDVLIGAGSVIAEGIIVKRGSVVGAGVCISASTRIVNRDTGSISYGVVPEYSVVVPGSCKDKGGCSISCAVIVKTVDDGTRKKIVFSELLRDE